MILPQWLALLLINLSLLTVIAGTAQRPPVAARSGAVTGRPEGARITFQKTVLDKEFRSEGAAVADVNRDGRPDILAGSLWYEAPHWELHETAPVKTFDRAKGYSESFLNYAADVNRDGWPDQIVVGMPGTPAFWRENPRGRPGHWKEHQIWRSANNESPAFAPLLATKQQFLVFASEAGVMTWYEPRPDPKADFTPHPISEPNAPGTKKFSHGMGVGDVNGDGRLDVLVTKGYWEAPRDPRTGPWKFVAADLGPDCAQMYTYDVNGDGLADVVSSSAHNIGVWWYEQRRGTAGSEFIRHVIDDSFSQSHSLALADINNDGLPDLVTGKRFWAHGPSGDVQPNDPAVLYWFELKRRGGKVEWVRHEIDNDSGVGTQVVAADVNNDRRTDVVVSNKKGVFVFTQLRNR